MALGRWPPVAALLLAWQWAPAWAACLPPELNRFRNETGRALPVRGGPLKLAFFDWSASEVLGYIVQILLEEHLGMQVEVTAPVAGSHLGPSVLAGGERCREANGWAPATEIPGGCDIENPQAHFMFQGWTGAVSVYDKMPPEIRPQLRPIGHSGYEGTFVANAALQAGASARPPVFMEYYRSLDQADFDPTRFAAALPRVTAEVERLGISTRDCNVPAEIPQAFRGCAEYERYTGDTSTYLDAAVAADCRFAPDVCVNSTWILSRPCREVGADKCVVWVTMGDGYFLQEIMQQALFWNIPFAFVVAASAADHMALSQVADLFYWWFPDDALMAAWPKRLITPESNAKEHRLGLFRSGTSEIQLYTLIWQRLQAEAPAAYALVAAAQFPILDMEQLMGNIVNAGMTVREAACQWAVASTDVWKAWIPNPTHCISGQGVTDAAGQFLSTTEGALTCDWCPEGYASVAIDSDARACTACPAGTAQPRPGQTTCALCPAGTFTADAASVSCDRCAAGFFQEELGQAACRPCPAPRTTLFMAASQAGDCVCPSGTFTPLNGSGCQSCPEAMTCAEPNTTAWALPAASTGDLSGFPFPNVQPGFMTLLHRPLVPYACKDPLWCPGGPPAACAWHRDPGLVGCGGCPAGWYEGSDRGCSECKDGDKWLAALLIVIGLVALCVVAVLAASNMLARPNAATMLVSIFGLTTAGLQSMGVFSQLTVHWASPLSDILRAFALVNLDLAILKLECSFGTGVVRSYSMRQVLAPCSALVVALAIKAKQRFREPMLEYRVHTLNTIGAMYNLLFVGIVMSAVSPFVCYQHPGDAGYSLELYPSILCFASREHSVLLALGGLAFGFVVLPFLTAVGYATWRHRALVSGASTSWQFRAFQFLFFRFKPTGFYFGFLLLLRSLFICLVPIVARDFPAVQLVFTASIFMAFCVAQLFAQPWRSSAANLVDAIFSQSLIILLMCAAMSSTFEGIEALVGGIGAFACAVFALVAVVGGGFAVRQVLVPSPFYHRFICHHKAHGAAQARILQILLVKRTGQTCFLDSDHLVNLDDLFDTVRCRVGRVFVLLTTETLRRPWCAGEVAVTYSSHKRLSRIETRGWQPPSRYSIKPERIAQFLADGPNLAEYGITHQGLAEALWWCLSSEVQSFSVKTDAKGSPLFHALVGSLLDASQGQGAGRLRGGAGLAFQNDGVVMAAAPECDEAIAAAHILSLKLRQLSSDCAPAMLLDILGSLSSDEWTEEVTAARTVVIIFSEGTLRSAFQLHVAAEAANQAKALPVTLPCFRFPSAAFYDKELPRLFANGSADIAEAIRLLFKLIAVTFSTHSSNQVLDAQTSELFKRIEHARAGRNGVASAGLASVAVGGVRNLRGSAFEAFPSVGKMAGTSSTNQSSPPSRGAKKAFVGVREAHPKLAGLMAESSEEDEEEPEEESGESRTSATVSASSGGSGAAEEDRGKAAPEVPPAAELPASSGGSASDAASEPGSEHFATAVLDGLVSVDDVVHCGSLN